MNANYNIGNYGFKRIAPRMRLSLSYCINKYPKEQ
jgi:hypothetical protein